MEIMNYLLGWLKIGLQSFWNIEAEKTPLQNQISSEKSDIEVSISSYSTIKQNFSDLDTNLTQLDGITGLTISNNSSDFDLEISNHRENKNSKNTENVTV